jgi:nucleoside-diphosphate-sugar epimerase
LIADVMGAQIEVVTDAQRLRPGKSEVERLWADNSKAFELLGWQPEYAGLDGLKRGLQETANWFADPTNLAQYKADIYNI